MEKIRRRGESEVCWRIKKRGAWGEKRLERKRGDRGETERERWLKAKVVSYTQAVCAMTGHFTQILLGN